MGHTRFLILPWVAAPHLASHLLGQVARRLNADWMAKYGHGLELLETFVDRSRFRGTCYRAAGWLHVGATTGRSRNDVAQTLRVPMEDIALSAFSVFDTQCPSFLAHQKAMEQNKGQSNAQTLFQIKEIPTDNHVRHTLDEVPPEELFPIYDEIYEALREQGVWATFQALGGTTPIALDGTWYFSSEKIHCDRCSKIEHSNGAITPVIVAPGQRHAIALRPEFITPQDGYTKQDCEIAAAKRWPDKEAAR